MLIDSSTKDFPNATGFLVLEGLNGAGKTTLLKRIEQYISDHDRTYRTTFEPGGSPIGRQIRQILLDQSTHKLAPVSELLFFCAERAEHVSKVIRPSLEQKKIVLCDRFYYSTLAFQGYGRGIDLTTTETCCNIAIQAVVPDLVLLLDIDEKIALERIHKRASSDVDGFESETLAFHKRLREGFLQIAQTSRERFLVLNAEQSTDQIWTQLEPTLDHWLSALHIEEAL